MKKRNILDVLQEDVVIPDVVLDKANGALETIRIESAKAKHDTRVNGINNDRKKYSHRKSSKKSKKKYLLIALVAALAVGTINAAAAYISRSKSLTGELHISEEQHVQMEETHMSTFVNQASTSQGITVTAIQSITDNYYTHIAFRVEGYQVDAGIQPDFEYIRILVDGHDSFEETSPENSFNYGASFYNGLVSGPDGNIVNDDGSPVQLNADGGFTENYTLEDGSMEYHITLSNSMNKGFFIGKPIHVELKNLGTVDKAQYQPGVEGTWTFDWTLEGSSQMRECSLNAPLGDSGATVVKAEISPISLRAEFQYPRQEIQEKGIDENGKEITMTSYKEPPRLSGVRMKDGTVYPYLYLGPGGQGYENNNSDRYTITFAIDRVIDVEQVESLLFSKSYEEGRGTSIEENFYIVPLK